MLPSKVLFTSDGVYLEKPKIKSLHSKRRSQSCGSTKQPDEMLYYNIDQM